MTEWRADRIAFRPLRGSDLRLIHRWLNAEHVRPGWFADGTYPSGGYSREAVGRDFGEHVDGHGPIAAFVIEYAGLPVGYVQSWRVGDFFDYAGHVVDDPAQAATTASLDLFVGEAEYVGGGLGPLIVRAFLREIVFGASDATAVVINPEAGNVRAIRAYERAGFRHLWMVQPPGRPTPSYLMRIERPTGTER